MINRAICCFRFILFGLCGVFSSAAANPKLSSRPTAVLFDGICANQRSVRAPTVYFCSVNGEHGFEVLFPLGWDAVAAYKVNCDIVSQLYLLAMAPENKVRKGRVNFYVYFSDDAGSKIFIPVSKEILGKMILVLPAKARSRVALMYEHG